MICHERAKITKIGERAKQIGELSVHDNNFYDKSD
jgi:hypothetical protein